MENQKEKVYMVCDWYDGNADGGAWNIGVEYMGNCSGRILKEDGTELARHHSSTFGWLREDLKSKIINPRKYQIVDLIGEKVPKKFLLIKSAR
jgi:hypothetical protein